jgi:SAM-dependent methyltransferase/uncharacterized protein YbaR (Trm112 family)
MKFLHQLLPLLKCPQCRNGTLRAGNDSLLHCGYCEMHYPVVHGCPVLLRSDNAVFCLEDYKHVPPSVKDNGERRLVNLIPSPSINLASERILGRVRELLSRRQNATVLVVGGGCQRKWLGERLCAGGPIRLIYSDIDVCADVDLFCDAHDLPFIEGVFDAVIATAVLEHVFCPERVAAEIHRVLKVGGVLYSELPFMQQVHEGAYDFTRYTLSGHRRLFNGFSELESGMVAGPATALVWALESFALAFVRRSILRMVTKAIVRIVFGWLKHFDRLLVSRPEAMDGASCTYFLGIKNDDYIPDTDIIARYVGAKHLLHT